MKIFKVLFFLYAFVFIIASFESCNKSAEQVSNLLDAIPQGSALLLKSENIDTVISVFKTQKTTFDFLYFTKLNNQYSISLIVDSLKKNNTFGENFISSSAVVALRKDGNCGICQLYVAKTKEIDNDDVEKLKETLKTKGNVSVRNFEGVEIVKFKPQNLELPLFFILKNQIVIISFSSKYVEDAITCLAGKSAKILDDKNFKNIYETSGKNQTANLFVNTKMFGEMFSCEMFAENNFVKTFNTFDCWSGFDVHFGGDGLEFNGFEIPISDTSFSQILKSQKPIEFSSLNVIPENSACYILTSFANPEKYDENLNAYLSKFGKLEQRTKQIENLNKLLNVDLKSMFYSIVKNEIAYVVTSADENEEKNTFVICGLQSQSAAQMELKTLVPQTTMLQIDESVGVEVFQMPCENIPALLFGDFYSNCKGRFVCCVNNFMIFANSLADVHQLVYDVVLNKTMKTSLSHNSFLKRFSTSSTMFLYYSFATGTEIQKRIISQKYSTDIDAHRDSIATIGDFGLQMKNVDDLFYCNAAFVKSERQTVSSVETIWESNIGTSIYTKPYVVKNHDNNTREIVLQDENNVLYLLNASGREIWKLQINEPIMSDIVQVDAYQNGKLQYIFSTKSKIYMVDRLGNFIEKYPINLRSNAVMPMSVFDYENNLNYRIAVACEDKKVYMYDISGNLLKGWNCQMTENMVNSQISHYVLDEEDFIAFHDTYNAYFVSRNGSAKQKYLTKFKFSNNKIYCDLSSSPRFVTTSSNGTIYRLYKNGTQDSVVIKPFSNKHHFLMRDIDSDGIPEYLFTDSSKLEVYNSAKKLVFDYSFDSKVSEPVLYQFDSQIKIGITCPDTEEIYLLNTNGTLHEGFPLKGKTLFSICLLESASEYYNLLVGSRNGYLYNYKIKK